MNTTFHTTQMLVKLYPEWKVRKTKELQKSIMTHLAKDARELYLNYIYPARGLNVSHAEILKQYSTIIKAMDDLYNIADYCI